MKQIFIFSFIAMVASSCSGILPHRSFQEEMDYNGDPMFVPGEDFPVVGGDSGDMYRSREEIRKRTPMYDRDHTGDKESDFLKNELAQKEKELTLEELTLYDDVKPYLQNISERIYFVGLSLPQKVDYARSRRIDIHPSFDSPMRNIPDSLGQSTGGRAIASLNPQKAQNELYLGMTKYEVSSSWGRPSEVEVAGNPTNENERWVYRENGRVRYVYFESGYLQGWESN